MILFAIHVIFLIVVATLTIAILYHYKEYAPPQDRGRMIVKIFIINIIFLFLLSPAAFFAVQWSSLSSLFPSFVRFK